MIGLESDFTVLGLIFFDELADQHHDLPVRGAALVVGDVVQLVQHFAVNAD